MFSRSFGKKMLYAIPTSFVVSVLFNWKKIASGSNIGEVLLNASTIAIGITLGLFLHEHLKR